MGNTYRANKRLKRWIAAEITNRGGLLAVSVIGRWKISNWMPVDKRQKQQPLSPRKKTPPFQFLLLRFLFTSAVLIYRWSASRFPRIPPYIPPMRLAGGSFASKIYILVVPSSWLRVEWLKNRWGWHTRKGARAREGNKGRKNHKEAKWEKPIRVIIERRGGAMSTRMKEKGRKKGAKRRANGGEEREGADYRESGIGSVK